MDKRIRLYWARLDKEMKLVIIYSTVMVVSVLVFTAAARSLLLGGTNQIAVTPTSISDQIIQDIKATEVVDGVLSFGAIDADGQNFTVDNVVYFADRQWAVANLHPKEAVDQGATIIMQLKGNQYEIAMGPGTNFPRNALEQIGAPAGLINHLDERGLVSTIGG